MVVILLAFPVTATGTGAVGTPEGEGVGIMVVVAGSFLFVIVVLVAIAGDTIGGGAVAGTGALEIIGWAFCSLGEVDDTTVGVDTVGESVGFDVDGVDNAPSSLVVSGTGVDIGADIDNVSAGFDSGAFPFPLPLSASVDSGCGFGGPGAFGSKNRAGTPLAASEPLPTHAPTRRLHL